jgi:2,3-bisphosphoglycerate-dependent phosphoglycerate mutase
MLEAADMEYIPVHKDYRLNERMYGALAGLDKKETVEKHGAEQVRTCSNLPSPNAGSLSPTHASCHLYNVSSTNFFVVPSWLGAHLAS